MLLALFVLFSVLFFIPTIPTIYDSLPVWMKRVLPEKGVVLGLDLQGGIHLVLQVEEDRAVEIAVDRSVNAIHNLLAEKDIQVTSAERIAQARIQISFDDETIKPEIQKSLEEFPAFYEVDKAGTDTQLVYQLREAEVSPIRVR